MTADDQYALADEFELRNRLRLPAIRPLGSPDEADDVVQETWVRLNHAQTGGTTIVNLGGWLTTVASRVYVDAMRRDPARREGWGVVDALDPRAQPAVDDDLRQIKNNETEGGPLAATLGSGRTPRCRAPCIFRAVRTPATSNRHCNTSDTKA